MPQSFTYEKISANLLDFCTVLRVQGFLLGPLESQDALNALLSLDLADYQQVRDGLSLIFCSSPDQEALFDLLFRAYFLPAPTKERPPESQAKATEGDGESGQEAPQARKKQQSRSAEISTSLSPAEGSAEDSDDEAARASPITLKAFFSPFSSSYEAVLEVSDQDKDAMAEAARRLIQRLSLGKTRRWRSMSHGPRFHFRKTLRKALATGGEAIKPAWLGHPPRKPQFVLLLDSSRSMLAYSDTLLQFARALSQRSSHIEVFLFSTQLKRVTRTLRKTLTSASLRLSDLDEAYGGGTKIGSSLAEFVRRYGQGSLHQDSLVLIASDGLDTGTTEVLKRAMREIHRRSAGVLWLNPLIDTPGYQPSAAAMKAALPYIDTFCTVKDVASLQRLSKQLKLRH